MSRANQVSMLGISDLYSRILAIKPIPLPRLWSWCTNTHTYQHLFKTFHELVLFVSNGNQKFATIRVSIIPYQCNKLVESPTPWLHLRYSWDQLGIIHQLRWWINSTIDDDNKFKEQGEYQMWARFISVGSVFFSFDCNQMAGGHIWTTKHLKTSEHVKTVMKSGISNRVNLAFSIAAFLQSFWESCKCSQHLKT